MNGWKFAAGMCALGALVCMLAQSLFVSSGIGGPRGSAAWGFGAMLLLLAAAIIAIRGLKSEL